jgi:hypothetical protein
MIRIVCNTIVDNEKSKIYEAVPTFFPSPENRSPQSGHARAKGAAGEGGNPWCIPLLEASQARTARWCRLAPASWPQETSNQTCDLTPILLHAAPPGPTCELTRWGRTK